MRNHPWSWPLTVLATLSLAAVGCGGGGGPGGPGGGGMIPGGGKMNWLDDGVRKNAVFAAAALARSTSMVSMTDLLQITGSTYNGVEATSFGVAVTPPIGAATVLCGGVGGTGQQPFATITYSPGAEPVWTSCSVMISVIVLTGTTHVTGKFEGVFPKTGGGTKTISDGNFDLPMTVSVVNL